MVPRELSGGAAFADGFGSGAGALMFAATSAAVRRLLLRLSRKVWAGGALFAHDGRRGAAVVCGARPGSGVVRCRSSSAGVVTDQRRNWLCCL
jgi:hypothetical protein